MDIKEKLTHKKELEQLRAEKTDLEKKIKKLEKKNKDFATEVKNYDEALKNQGELIAAVGKRVTDLVRKFEIIRTNLPEKSKVKIEKELKNNGPNKAD